MNQYRRWSKGPMMSAELADIPDSRVDGLGVAQRWVLVVWAVLLIGSLLMVPWQAEIEASGRRSMRPAGYALVVSPPDPSSAWPRMDSRAIRNLAGVRVDVPRLAAQVLAVAVLGGVAFVLARNWDRRRPDDATS